MILTHRTSPPPKVYLLLFAILLLLTHYNLQAQPNETEAYNSLSYQWQYKPDSVFLQLKQRYAAAVQKGWYAEQGTALNQMGSICFHLGHYAQALEYYLDATQAFEKSHSLPLLADNYNDLGILYFYSRDTMQARQYYNSALKLYEQLHNSSGIAMTLGKIGHLFEKKQQYDSALFYQHRALILYSSLANKKGMAKIWENLGSIHEDLARYDSAMQYFRQALALYRLAGEKSEHIEVVNNIGDILRKTGRYREALVYTRMAVTMADSVHELYQLCSGYRDIAKTYNLLHRDDSAFIYLELSRKYLLDIYSQENARQMQFLQVQYELEQQNKEIHSLQNERRLNTIISISVAIIIVLLAILGIAVINRQKMKIRNEKALSEQNRHILTAKNQLMEMELKSRQLEEEKLKAEIRNRQLEKEKLDTELKNRALEEDQLRQQIEIKTKELSTQALHVIQKNQLLEELHRHLEEMIKDEKRDQKKQLKQLSQQINQNFNNDSYWEDFRNTFEQIHQSFFAHLKEIAPDLTSAELRLVSLLKMNMNSNDMATMLGISQDSLRVSRYRLRKKLNLGQGENLYSFLQNLG